METVLNNNTFVPAKDYFLELREAIAAKVNRIYSMNLSDSRYFYHTDKKTSLKIYAAYLNTIEDAETVQNLRCSACEKFIRDYGDLVFLGQDGLEWVMWPSPLEIDSASPHAAFLTYMEEKLKASDMVVRKPLLINRGHSCTLGVESNTSTKLGKTFMHMHAKVNPTSGVESDRMKAFVDSRDDYYRDLKAGLLDLDLLNKAKVLLETKNTHSKFIALRRINHLIKMMQVDKNERLISMVESIPVYPKLKNTMLGNLLTDILSGVSVDKAIKTYNSGMSHERHMKSVREADDNDLEIAAKLIDDLGYVESLDRRIKTLEETPDEDILWEIKPVAKKEDVTEVNPIRAIKKSAKKDGTPFDLGQRDDVLTFEQFLEFLNNHEINKLKPVYRKYGVVGVITTNNQSCKPIMRDGGHDSWFWFNDETTDLVYKSNEFVGVTDSIAKIIAMPQNKSEIFKDYHGYLFLSDDKEAMDALAKASSATTPLFPEIIDSKLHGARRALHKFSLETPMSLPTGTPLVGIAVNSSELSSRAKVFKFEVVYTTNETTYKTVLQVSGM